MVIQYGTSLSPTKKMLLKKSEQSYSILPWHPSLCHPLQVHVTSQQRNVRINQVWHRVGRQSICHQCVHYQLQCRFPPYWFPKQNHCLNSGKVLLKCTWLKYKLCNLTTVHKKENISRLFCHQQHSADILTLNQIY